MEPGKVIDIFRCSSKHGSPAQALALPVAGPIKGDSSSVDQLIAACEPVAPRDEEPPVRKAAKL